MSDTFNCPNCGAPLDYQGSAPIIRCPYCNTSVVVPDNLHAKPSFSSQPGNFTLGGAGDLGGLLQKAMRFKEVKDLAQAGNKLEAIRVYREITGADLETARAAVDALAANQPIMLSSFSAADVRASVAEARQVLNSPTFSAPQTIQTDATTRSGSRAGCWVGCLSVGLVVLALAIVLGSMAGPLGLGNMFSGLPIPGIGFATQQMSFGGEGAGPGLFTGLQALAVNPATGAIFAADKTGGRVQAFDPSGKFITQWKLTSDASSTYITGMAADRKGNVFIVMNGDIYRYDANGALQQTLKVPDANFYNLVVGADGNLVAAASITFKNESIIRMTPDGAVLNTFADVISSNGGKIESVIHVAVDGSGDIYAAGSDNTAVFKFSPDGKFISRFGSKGTQNGQFNFLTGGIAVDGYGRVYVGDYGSIQVFDSNGLYQNTISTFDDSFCMTFDDQNNLYTTNRGSGDVDKITRFSVQKPPEN
jgi:sugar lactone lactonase YvrE